MTRRKNKPSTPSRPKRVVDFEVIGLQGSAAGLPMNADIEVIRKGEERDRQKVDEDSARRLDAFAALKSSMRKEPFIGCYDAARRLERDILVSLNLHDKGRPMERFDGTRNTGRMDAMLEAFDSVRGVEKRLGAREWWLLNELIKADSLRFTNWREIVAHVTGETHDHAQGCAVRSACVNLRDAYTSMEEKRAA